MTAPEAKMFAYHMGIVVHSREAACARYFGAAGRAGVALQRG